MLIIVFSSCFSVLVLNDTIIFRNDVILFLYRRITKGIALKVFETLNYLRFSLTHNIEGLLRGWKGWGRGKKPRRLEKIRGFVFPWQKRSRQHKHTLEQEIERQGILITSHSGTNSRKADTRGRERDRDSQLAGQIRSIRENVVATRIDEREARESRSLSLSLSIFPPLSVAQRTAAGEGEETQRKRKREMETK